MVAPSQCTKPHDLLPQAATGARHAPNSRRGPDEILALAAKDPHSRILAISAKCCQCKGSDEGVRSCVDGLCALWAIRPFQLSEPKGAPHCSRFDAVELPDDETAEVSD